MTFVPSGFFVLRTPLLPFDELIDWSKDLEAAGTIDDRERLPQAVASDRARLRLRLRAIVDRPEVREALYVASPDLVDGLSVWLREPETARGQRVERAIVRYFVRMAGRPTPFGLFAGTSAAPIGSGTRLECAGRQSYRRHARLDMNYLSALTESQGRDADVRRSLVYHPNSSLYRAGRRWRYMEARLAKGSRSYHLVAVEETPHLAQTLERAKDGARIQELAEILASRDGDVSIEEAREFVNELVDGQILIPDLECAVTGREPIHGLLEALRNETSSAAVHECLEGARLAMESMNKESPGVEPARYREIAARLGSLPAEVMPSMLFQVDMAKPVHDAVLGAEVVEELGRAVETLHRVASVNVDPIFAQFREAFTTRYEGREVPLLEVLDEEVGIGFQRSTAPGAEASPLLDGLIFPPGATAAGRWSVRDALLARRVEEATREGAREVSLSEEDLKVLGSEESPPLPDAFAVSATLCASSESAVAQGDFHWVLQFAGGPSGARMLGRFCHADPQLSRFVEAHLRAEEACDPEAIFAEVVHLPEGRLGNILCRPVLREYEIPFLGVSGAPRDRQIPPSDLLVSVQGGRVVLRSARLGRRVIPRLTSAHTYTRRGLGVYRFLALLQDQGVACGMTWIWGALEALRFLPRLRAGRAVLSPARWRLDRHDLKALGSYHGADRFWAVQRLRSAWNLPRYVELADSDNELPIDLDNALCVETFVELVKKRSDAVLKEMLPGQEDLCARGPEGRFVHEIIVPFVRKEGPPPRHHAPVVLSSAAPRRFAPGSEWLYVKLYTGTASSDLVLREAVAGLVREAIDSGAADRWFFVRYADPDWHLRIRLHGDGDRLRLETYPKLHAALETFLEDGLVWRVQLDTYEREMERYGGAEGIEIAERVFHADSDAALAILDQIEGDAGADIRWRLTLRGIDTLLSDLGFDLEGRRRLMTRLREGFGKELRVEKSLEVRLGAKFRKERSALDQLVALSMASDDLLAPALEPLHARSRRLAGTLTDLKRLRESGRLTAPMDDLAASYIHMHVNRMLRSAHKAQELVLYDFLVRVYESRAARLKGRRIREAQPASPPRLEGVLELRRDFVPGLPHDHA
jgi:thiopeptide-type bacteriocin biosynthesis protein